MKIKALTIKQPWAWCIAAGHKDVENRGWRTSYRGPLAIHAGKAWDQQGAGVARLLLEDLGVVEPNERVGERHLLTTGAVVAVVELVDICDSPSCDCSVWAAPGQVHWRLANVRPFSNPPVASGRQGLWNYDLPAVAS